MRLPQAFAYVTKLLPAVLLVDDDQTTNYLNRLLLKKPAVTDHILVAHDGREALALLAVQCQPLTAQCPRLLRLDMNIPGLNGIQFLKAHQQLPLVSQNAIVSVKLTTSLHPRDVQRARAGVEYCDGLRSQAPHGRQNGGDFGRALLGSRPPVRTTAQHQKSRLLFAEASRLFGPWLRKLTS